MALKSGTNSFHGSAFEFLRNDKLDANDFFANRAGLEREPLRFDQFGGTLGGPVWRNRTFFFGSYQGTRNRNSSTSVVTVPTPEQVRGNFGGIDIYDATKVVAGNRQQFANNVIPEGRMDRSDAKSPRFIQAESARPRQQLRCTRAAERRRQSIRLSGDHNFSERDKLFVRFNKLTATSSAAAFVPRRAIAECR